MSGRRGRVERGRAPKTGIVRRINHASKWLAAAHVGPWIDNPATDGPQHFAGDGDAFLFAVLDGAIVFELDRVRFERGDLWGTLTLERRCREPAGLTRTSSHQARSIFRRSTLARNALG